MRASKASASVSPVLSPGLYDNHSNCSGGSINEDDSNKGKRGRKRKVKEINDPLKEKVNAALRIHKLKTTQELAQQYNIEVDPSQFVKEQTINERIASSFTAKSHNFPKISCDVDDETKTKSELMHRFLSSTTPNDNDEILNDIDDDDHSFGHYDKYDNRISNEFSDPSLATCSNCIDLPAVNHYNFTTATTTTTSTNSNLNVNNNNNKSGCVKGVRDEINDEINDILSQLPPLNISEIDWGDDSNAISTSSHNHDYDQQLNEQFYNNNEETTIANDDNFRTRIDDDSLGVDVKLSHNNVSESDVEKVIESKWEFVNGCYDSEYDWRDWSEMTNSVSYNGDLLHILPYVNIDW